MKTLIKYEMKKKLTQTISVFMIVILITFILLDISNANQTRENRPFGKYDKTLSSNTYNRIGYETEKRREAYTKAVYSYDLSASVYKDMEIAAKEDDHVTYTRLRAFAMLLAYKEFGVARSSISEAQVYMKIGRLWEEVSGGIPFEDIDFRPFSVLNSSRLDSFYLVSRYYHYLYQHELRPVYIDENNNISTIYRYFNKILPYALLVLVILFNYNSINRDHRRGSLKLLLSQSLSRVNCYLGKWICGVLQLLTVITIPPFLVGLFLGITNGFVSIKYPITLLGGVLTRLIPITNYFDPSVMDEPASVIKRAIGHVATSYPTTNTLIYHPDVDIVPFYKYLLIVFLLVILFAGFSVALIQIISTIINNEIISLLVGTIAIGLGVIISSNLTVGEYMNFSPFNMYVPTRIVEGLYNVTTLGAIITLITSTILLLAIGCLYFNKKHI